MPRLSVILHGVIESRSLNFPCIGPFPWLGMKGYRAGLVTGDGPELFDCLRIAGKSVWWVNYEMTLHDTVMARLG